MKTAIINLKIEPALKKKAQARAKKLGVPLSYILRTSLYNFANGHRVKLPTEEMTPRLEKLIEEVRAEIARGEVSPAFDGAEDAIAWLEQEIGDDV